MTEYLHADTAGIARAAALLRSGELVAFGTETVYGLGADAMNDTAVAGIFAAKQRPRFNPLICHYPDAAAAFADVVANETARRLAAAFWPGPLTLVLPRRPGCSISLLASAGLDTLAVRVPAQSTALALLRAAARPIAAPSANRSGQVSPTTARHVLDELSGRIAAVLDCGPCLVGVESTVLDLTAATPELLRPGGIATAALEAAAGPIKRMVSDTSLAAAGPRSPTPRSPTPRSPGMLASHYAPKLPVRLDAGSVAADEALLAFGPPPEGAGTMFNLSVSADLTEAAARLFTGLRQLDAAGLALGLRCIAAMPIPPTGLGEAINDRLRRAAAPRG